ncbi:MAG: hypothetical protein ACE5GD_08030 [Candidatus Geothermarchaeales archaeon]
MKRKHGVAVLGVSFLFVLGVFVNPVFLYLGIFSLCPLMHLLGGHGSHGMDTEHKDHGAKQKKDKNEAKEGCH